MVVRCDCLEKVRRCVLIVRGGSGGGEREEDGEVGLRILDEGLVRSCCVFLSLVPGVRWPLRFVAIRCR